MHEADLYENNQFITLTYNNENLPDDLSVSLDEWQRFMKRFRKEYSESKIRFFGCGEYGDKNFRPHYHAIIFNMDFEDKELIKLSKLGHKYYRSERLAKVWPKGYNVIGDVTFESAAYVARYVMKKRLGKQNEIKDYYTRVDDQTGQILEVDPEFVTMSRRPGIGRDWYELYGKNAHEKDFITMNGIQMKPPKYYDGLLEKIDESKLADIKAERVEYAKKFEENNGLERLKVREQIQKRKAEKLIRNIE